MSDFDRRTHSRRRWGRSSTGLVGLGQLPADAEAAPVSIAGGRQLLGVGGAVGTYTVDNNTGALTFVQEASGLPQFGLQGIIIAI